MKNKQILQFLDSCIDFTFGSFIILGVVTFVTAGVNHYQNMPVLDLLTKIFAGSALIIVFSGQVIHAYKIYLERKIKKDTASNR